MAKTKLIGMDRIQSLTNMDEINQIVDKTFREFGRRRIKNPTKVTLDLGNNSDWPDYEGYMNAMPAYIEWLDVAGIKWVGGFDGKRKEANYPYITGMILMIDPQMGTFETILDGTFITNMRTGAQTAVILKNLGFEREQDITVGLYGTGMQAKTSLMALSEWYNIQEVKLSNHRYESVPPFIDEIEHLIDGSINYKEDPAEASDADVVITATKAEEPIIHSEWIKPDTVLIPLGSSHEIDNQTIADADYVIVDHAGQAAHRGALADAFSKDIIDQNDIDSTIGSLASGRTQLGDLSGKTVIAVPIGMGAHDVAIAGVIAKRAQEQDIDEEFEFQPY